MVKRKQLDKDETVFIGIDLHKRTWHVTIRTWDIELFCGSIEGLWKRAVMESRSTGLKKGGSGGSTMTLPNPHSGTTGSGTVPTSRWFI